MSSNDKRPRPGESVVLTEIPPGLLDGLPPEDQQAIAAAVGKPVVLNEYDEQGTAELQFTDDNGVIHFLYVSRSFIQPA
jgi:hypothetical protein